MLSNCICIFSLLLAFLHFPVYTISQKSVGLFDIFCIPLFFIALLRNSTKIRGKKIAEKLKIGFFIYAVFVLYAAVSQLAFGGDRFISHGLSEEFDFGSLLLLKHVQYLCICIIFFRSLPGSSKATMITIAVSVLFVAIYGIYATLISQEWYRLGLFGIYSEVSSNPAGFVLGSATLTLIYYIKNITEIPKKLNVLFVTAILAGCLGLFLTFSRTNNLSFYAALGYYYVILVRRGRRIVLGAFIVVSLLASGFILEKYQESGRIDGGYTTSVATYVTNPSRVFSDSSMQMRIYDVWGSVVKDWLETPLTTVFGIGFGNLRMADSLYANLLVTTGIVGLAIYLSVLLTLSRVSDGVALLALFVLINGAAVESTLNSFRCVQVLIPLIVVMAGIDSHLSRVRSSENALGHRFI